MQVVVEGSRLNAADLGLEAHGPSIMSTVVRTNEISLRIPEVFLGLFLICSGVFCFLRS